MQFYFKGLKVPVKTDQKAIENQLHHLTKAIPTKATKLKQIITKKKEILSDLNLRQRVK